MKVVIVNERDKNVYMGIEKYETTCFGKACNYCPFRFKCYTERDYFEVSVGEMDDLSLRFVAGGELLELIHRHEANVHYYTALFYKITRERDMNRGYIPLLTRTK